MLNFSLLPRQNYGGRFLKEFRGSGRVRFLLVFCIAAATLAAQDSSSTGSGDSGNVTERITAASQFFDHDFVNVYGYGNGVWDSRVPQGLNSSNQESYGGGFGWEAGGGITATHTFRDGGITVNYRGSYRDYQSATSGSGDEQSLSLGYNKRLNRHWTFSANVVGGILTAGESFYSASSVSSVTPGNPYSLESRFAQAGLGLTYAQTRRLSYVFQGSFLYSGYVNPGGAGLNPLSNPVSTRGVTGSASVLYRLTSKTTVGGSYARSYYAYSGKSGTADIDSLSLQMSHQFSGHWQVDVSGGVNRSHSQGFALTPFEFGNALYLFYLPYNRTVYSPSYQAVLTRAFRHSSFSLSGGQSVLSGNGLYLASRDQFVNGAFSYSTRRSNFSLGGNYARLSSVSTAALSQTYSYYGVSGNYGVTLVRYLSGNLRWDLLHYDNPFGNSALNAYEQRVSFGLSISSKSVPLTLF
jgi:hypothetical protein